MFLEESSAHGEAAGVRIRREGFLNQRLVSTEGSNPSLTVLIPPAGWRQQFRLGKK